MPIDHYKTATHAKLHLKFVKCPNACQKRESVLVRMPKSVKGNIIIETHAKILTKSGNACKHNNRAGNACQNGYQVCKRMPITHEDSHISCKLF